MVMLVAGAGGADCAANEYQVSLASQQVLVWGPSLPTFDEVTEKINKTGKKITDKKVIEKEDEIPDITTA